MNEFEETRIWNNIDIFRKEIKEQGICIAKIKQYIEDKEKSSNKKITVIGVVFGVIAVGIAIFK